MRKRFHRGLSLTELLTALSVSGLVILGTMTLMITGLRSFSTTQTDVTLTQQNAQGLRHVAEGIRSSMTVSITNTGKTLSFTTPARTANNDAVTGEKEFIYPFVSDGVARSYVVDFTAGTLTETPGNRVLVRNITGTDPDPNSSQYNQVYSPFQLTTIGSRRAISINLITREVTRQGVRYERMKTTVLIRNAQ